MSQHYESALSLDDAALLEALQSASRAAQSLIADIRQSLTQTALDKSRQQIRHGFGWFAAYTEALSAVALWACELHVSGRLTEIERMIAAGFFAETLLQLRHGIAMSQDEFIRPQQLNAEEAFAAFTNHEQVARFCAHPCISFADELVTCCADAGHFGDSGLDDTLREIAAQFRRFAQDKILPDVQGWHLRDELIPDALIRELADLGVFGLTIAEDYGGVGMGKMAMCVVTEELSRGFIGVGSLATRSEIAAELIQHGGTEAQKRHYLPKIASGEILPTAVFTEPNTGSDLASLQTRAVKQPDGSYRITGAKTWITHGARSDVMTLLARTDSDEPGHRGLTMFLAPKPRGDEQNPFPDPKMSGSEIPVLGYRGMKEYEIAFDDFIAPADSVLGGVEGQGFKQLMQTFESARIQTASRAIGVAVNALELGFGYAHERKQFGRKIIEFERISGKLARMIVDIAGVRQLSYMAARKKDQGGRCDVEAGMAKLLAARLAWSAADNAVQIHGGNGYALEYPVSRVLCDARILSIFEGAAEMQAEVIARGLLPA